jgi:hypothetical protein
VSIVITVMQKPMPYQHESFLASWHLLKLLVVKVSVKPFYVLMPYRPTHLYHLGLPRRLVRSNVALANHRRNWRIFYDFAKILITEARTFYQTQPLDFNFDACVYALDSTTIDLCLSMFPWAHFRKTKSAVKMHTMINLQGKIPDFILVSTGKMHDVQVMDVIEWEPGSWYAMDRGYLDFERLYRIHQCGAFFVTRSKKNTLLPWHNNFSFTVIVLHDGRMLARVLDRY